MRSIIYLVRSTMQNAQLIAQQVKATNRWVGVPQKPQVWSWQAGVRQLSTVHVLIDIGRSWQRGKLPNISVTLRAC